MNVCLPAEHDSASFLVLPSSWHSLLCASPLCAALLPAGRVPADWMSYRSAVRTGGHPAGYAAAGEGGREGVPGYPYLPGCQAGAGAAAADLNDPPIARGAGATVSAVVQSKPTSARCFSRRGPVAPTEFLLYAALGGLSVSPRPPDPQSPSPTGSNMVAHSFNWSCSPGASANQNEPRDVTSCWELKSFLGVFFPL